jgi:hypothetical protein
MERLVVEYDRIAADLDQEIRIEEDRTRIQNPAHTAYSFYAKATASRRDNLRRPANDNARTKDRLSARCRTLLRRLIALHGLSWPF